MTPESTTATTHPARTSGTPKSDPDWLDQERWPFTPRYLNSGQGRIAYADVGTGPTLLLVHVGMWSFVWRDLVDRLCSDFRCVVVEPPASGLSDQVPSVAMSDAASAVTTVVESLELDDLTLVVHDLGGTAAFHAAADWHRRVRGIVAVNSFAWRPEGVAFRTMLAVMGSRLMLASDVITGWLPRMTSSRFGVGRHLDRRDRKAFRRGMYRGGRASFHRYMRSVRHHDYQPVDRAVRLLADRPLLTIFGERNDQLGFQPRWAERFNHVTQVEIPAAQHFPMCDDPDRVASTIRAWFETNSP